jgi:hypothetical protein
MITCLCIYPTVMGSSSYCVMCLYYECLLSWICSIFYDVCVCVCVCVCVADWCSILNNISIIGFWTSICASFMCNIFLLIIYIYIRVYIYMIGAGVA